MSKETGLAAKDSLNLVQERYRNQQQLCFYFFNDPGDAKFVVDPSKCESDATQFLTSLVELMSFSNASTRAFGGRKVDRFGNRVELYLCDWVD